MRPSCVPRDRARSIRGLEPRDLVAPTIGASIAGRDNNHASATCAGGTPRSSATSQTAFAIATSASDPYNRSAIVSLSPRAVLRQASGRRVSQPRASGLHGSTPMPRSRHSGSVSRSSSR